jgi:hypothetical protein
VDAAGSSRRISGITDKKSRSMSDLGGNGRGGQRNYRTGITDAESGSKSDRGD